VLVLVNGRLAVTRVQIGIEWFRLFIFFMNKNFYTAFAVLFAVIMSLSIISCGGDDKNEPIDTPTIIKAADAIVGSWNYVKKTHTSDKTYETPASGTLILKNDGTFTMTGDIIQEMVNNYGNRSLTELSGKYSFSQGTTAPWGTLVFSIDEKYREEKIYINSWNLETHIYEDGGITMTLLHEWKQGSFMFNNMWYFKKS
jgi:hypothetical protein